MHLKYMLLALLVAAASAEASSHSPAVTLPAASTSLGGPSVVVTSPAPSQAAISSNASATGSSTVQAPRTTEVNNRDLLLLSAIAAAASAFFSLLSSSAALYYGRVNAAASARAANISATIGLMKEWRQYEELGRIGLADEILKNAGEPKLATEGLDALSDTILPEHKMSERDIVRSVSHLCDEISLRVMCGEANEDAVLSFIGGRIHDLYALYRPMLEREREMGSDRLYQAGFEALAERASFPVALRIEAERINSYLRSHRRGDKYNVPQLIEEARRSRTSAASQETPSK